jgi:hypothetical protein
MEQDAIIEALQFLKDRIEEVNVKVDELNDVLFKQVLEPAKQGYEDSLKQMVDKGYNEFAEKHKNNPTLEQYKAIYSNEPDPMEQMYASWLEYEGDEDEDTWFNTVVEKLSQEIENIKKSLGFSKQAEVTDVDVKDGTIEITDPVTDESAVVESEVVKETTPEETINSPEEIAEFEKKLEQYL